MSAVPPPVSDQPVLKLLNVESSYGPIKAIRGVSLQVRRGERVAHDGRGARGEQVVREHRRFHAGAAHLVDGGAAGGERQAGAERRLTRGRLALARGLYGTPRATANYLFPVENERGEAFGRLGEDHPLGGVFAPRRGVVVFAHQFRKQTAGFGGRAPQNYAVGG